MIYVYIYIYIYTYIYIYIYIHVYIYIYILYNAYALGTARDKDFIKLRGSIVLRFLFVLSDPSAEICHLMENDNNNGNDDNNNDNSNNNDNHNNHTNNHNMMMIDSADIIVNMNDIIR